MDSFLQRYHAEPGRTVAMLERWRTPEGLSSYEVLVDETARLPRESRLLDLACGDGYLLGLLSRRGFSDLAGLDRSPEELAGARARLGPRAELHCQEASAMPLEDGSVDTIVCHMALMLMDPIEPILAEIARVLRPGGSFIAVMNRTLHDPVFEIYRRWLHRTTVEQGLARLRLGDPRVFTVEGLEALIRGQHVSDTSLFVHDFEVRTRATPAVLWSSLRLSYDVFQLSAPAQATLERRILRGWEPLLEGDGQLSCAMGMRLLRCRTPVPRGQP